jgi:hypothetical protein
MKLESYILEGVFISPKLYGYRSEVETIIKVKGFDCKYITLEDLKTLLIPNIQLSIPSRNFRRSITLSLALREIFK